jgi:hypothetical protein
MPRIPSAASDGVDVAQARLAPVSVDVVARDRHLRAIWPMGLPGGQWIGITTIAPRASGGAIQTEWCATIEDACVSSIPDDRNVYVGLALVADDIGPLHRATNESVLAIPGFVADLDVKTGAFKSLDDALTFLSGFPVPPTLVILSGHGVQAWWLFEEPEVFEKTERREHIARISRAFGQFIDDRAKAIGVTLDRVSDLARIMRLAGSVNVKNPLDPQPVEILSDDGPRLPGPGWLADELGIVPVDSPSAKDDPPPRHFQGFSMRQCRSLDWRRLESHLEPGERLFDIWHGQNVIRTAIRVGSTWPFFANFTVWVT